MIQKWELIFWQDDNGNCPVEEWLSELSPVHKKRMAKLLGYLENLGNELKMPHSKCLTPNLYELRDTGKGPGYRLFYCFQKRFVVLLLVPGEKDSQKRDIQKAQKIMEGLNHER